MVRMFSCSFNFKNLSYIYLKNFLIMKFISEKVAVHGMFAAFTLITIFHLFVLSGVIPYNIVWGGRLETKSEMVRFELFSILLNIIMATIVAIRAGIIKFYLNPIVLKAFFWAMFILFSLNTLGNLFSLSLLEKVIFTPLTFILAICSLKLALSKVLVKSNKSI